MSRVNHHSRFPLTSLVLAAAMVVPAIHLASRTAHADVGIRVRGDVKVQVRVGNPRRRGYYVRRAPRYVTPAPHVQLRVGGRYWHGEAYVGRRFAEPPPPPPPCDCALPPPPPVYHHAPAPSYYAEPAHYAGPAPVAVVDTRPALPRFGIGLFAGSVAVEDRAHGEDLGLLGRVRITRRLFIEGEIAKTEMDDTRVDRRLGGALVYDVAPRSTWSLQLLGGGGVTQVEVGRGDWHTQQQYGELGAGLVYRITPKINLGADLRIGSRAQVEDTAPDAYKAVAPSAEEEENYTRGRLSALLYF